MEIANAWLYLNKLKNDVPIKGLTPAELVFLVKNRQDSVGTFPVHDLQIVGSVKRSTEAEKHRLGQKYGRPAGEKDQTKTHIEAMYPGVSAELPETFESTKLLKQALEQRLGDPVPHPDDVKPETIEALEPVAA